MRHPGSDPVETRFGKVTLTKQHAIDEDVDSMMHTVQAEAKSQRHAHLGVDGKALLFHGFGEKPIYESKSSNERRRQRSDHKRPTDDKVDIQDVMFKHSVGDRGRYE